MKAAVASRRAPTSPPDVNAQLVSREALRLVVVQAISRCRRQAVQAGFMLKRVQTPALDPVAQNSMLFDSGVRASVGSEQQVSAGMRSAGAPGRADRSPEAQPVRRR